MPPTSARADTGGIRGIGRSLTQFADITEQVFRANYESISLITPVIGAEVTRCG